MNELGEQQMGPDWHTDDFLVRIAHGESVGTAGSPARPGAQRGVPGEVHADFGKPSLDLVRDEELRERFSVARESAFEDRTVVVFGARTRSIWSLNVLAGRFTRFAYDWPSLRAVILAAAGKHSGRSILDEISLDRLYSLTEVLSTRGLDPEADRALTAHIADRLVAGHALAKKHLEPFLRHLIRVGLPERARELLPRLTEKNWARHALIVELEHPRFGGSLSSLSSRLNEPYRQLALEVLAFDQSGLSAFERLSAAPADPAPPGPSMTVIMPVRNPGEETLAAARSVVAQSYQNWELLVVDDGSTAGADVLARVAALDSRIRVVRNADRAGIYARVNDALQASTAEIVALHDGRSWSHPRRLEVQVHDLVTNPTRVANTVHAVRVTADFSLLDAGAAQLYPAESTIAFRRGAALEAIGFFDTVAEGAAIEFRRRLELVTQRVVPALVAGAPLQYALSPATDPAGAELTANLWNEPRRLAYLSAVRSFHERIGNGAEDPRLPHRQDERAFFAPSQWCVPEKQPSDVDLLIVLDGRELSARVAFLRMVVAELSAAAAAGLRVAVLQAISLGGPRAQAMPPVELQDLLDAGTVQRVEPDEPVRAAVAVVRHAGAAQGHPGERWAIETQRVVVVEEPRAGDVRGRTVAKPDVLDTVEGWFGVRPDWIVAPPVLAAPRVAMLEAGSTGVRASILTDVPSRVRRIRLVSAGQSVELNATVTGASEVIGQDPDAALLPGEWRVVVESDAGAGHTITQAAPVTADTVIWNGRDHLAVRADEGGFLLLASEATADLPARGDFVAAHLSSDVTLVRIVGESVEVLVGEGDSTLLARLYALREVDGAVVRRRDFTAATSGDGRRVWRRPLAKFAGSRWRLYGTFRTSLGTVEFPLDLNERSALEGTNIWEPQILSGERILIAPPQPGRIVSATRKVSARFGGAVRRAAPLARPAAPSKVRFGVQHSASRLGRTPALSIVMPVYNVEPFLEHAITAVLDQDFTDFELIIVDDASSDNGRQIIEKYWKRDRRIRVFGLDHNTLGGAGIPSNIGVKAARGTYVAFADSDDFVTKTGLAALMRQAEAHSPDLVIGDFRTFTDKLMEGETSYDKALWAELPLSSPISIETHPALFRLSPVPWRKLYRRDFLEAHGILYPEGDYFYEDNPLHWFVLARAASVIVCEEVVSFHRMEREGQTMSAQAYRLGAFASHMNTVCNFLLDSGGDRREALFAAFIAYLDRTNWTITNQTQPAAAGMMRRRFGHAYEKAIAAAPRAEVAERTRSRLGAHRSGYPDVDLTVVIPVYNSAELLKQTIDSVLKIQGIGYNILLVDDGSTDDSLSILKTYENEHSNVHVFSQGNRGAGRARNSVIPLCTGRYTYFLDADDVVDPKALVAAVQEAEAATSDLLFFKYRIEYVDEGRSRAMFAADERIWQRLAATTRHADRQALVARLINYPWNRIIRTSLLHDANIFFGATVVHNDVLFHWHSITSAKRIGFADLEVCSHRKFGTREQVTNINDARRMAVLEALRSTHERISALSDYPNVEEEWKAFAANLLDWAKDRVPSELRTTYNERSVELAESFAGAR